MRRRNVPLGVEREDSPTPLHSSTHEALSLPRSLPHAKVTSFLNRNIIAKNTNILPLQNSNELITSIYLDFHRGHGDTGKIVEENRRKSMLYKERV